MTPERRREIEELYHLARERDPAVLANTEPELRREVETLLAQDSGGRIPDRQAAELSEESAATQAVAGAELGWAGQTVSHYRILEKLGTGGMGVVYKAFDEQLGRLVALKFLPAHMRHNEELKQRLTQEARAASALDHPNIVVVHAIDETQGGDLFIAMALHEGATLRERMSTGLPVTDALQIARQIASGLARAHEHGIIHRDIKPSNIIVDKDGIARIIDFGLAKSIDATATLDGSTKGTPLYMSPEQAAGQAIDSRTDLWSLGAVLYEMLAGRPPFSSDTHLQVMHAIVHNAPPRLRHVRPDLPAEIDTIVSRALEKDPAKRYQSAADMARDLSAILAAPGAPARKRSGWRTAHAIPILFVLVAGMSVWFYQRSERRHWAREQTIPEIAKLAGTKPLAAFLLLGKAEQVLPADPQLAQLAQSFTRLTSVESTPAGAKVEIQDYLSPRDAWFSLGTTPLRNVRVPNGYFRWRISKPGAGESIVAPRTADAMHFPLAAPGAAAGMVPVPGGKFGEMIDFVGWLYYDLPAFDIDRFEVTNAQYQEFVDQGGYRKPEYWKERFIKDGEELTWEQAMDLFRDPTGRPGPSTWEAGHFPSGQADYPVSGVSWYEAAAYAAFSGKSLPVLAQWYKAAPSDLVAYSINQSNFSGRGPARVGSSGGVGPYGTCDMSGNVREWCWNTVDGDRRFILGGAWRTQTYQAYDPEALPPFDRSAMNGVRCVRNRGPVPPDAAAPVVRQARDFSKVKPVSDELFQAYRTMYAYDRTSVNAHSEGIVENTADWTKEKISIDAGYENERLPLYLFLPKNVHPPYQAVLFFPSARVNTMPSSQDLGDLQFVDYAIKSGRALVYPIYKGTYERVGHRGLPGTIGDLTLVIQESKEVRRSVDYLESRSDIDNSKIAYLGVSQGAADGVIFTALEDRFKTVVFLDGGFFLRTFLPERDQATFAPRLKKPVLMVNGRYDFTFSLERAQEPMFRMLGAPEADKRHVVFDTPHDISQRKAELSEEVLAWLDKYLGRVN
jgi:serine/threonine protein kinase/formylglycine-generating enzyme required for sulfatase activity/predicted esterase